MSADVNDDGTRNEEGVPEKQVPKSRTEASSSESILLTTKIKLKED